MLTDGKYKVCVWDRSQYTGLSKVEVRCQSLYILISGSEFSLKYTQTVTWMQLFSLWDEVPIFFFTDSFRSAWVRSHLAPVFLVELLMFGIVSMAAHFLCSWGGGITVIFKQRLLYYFMYVKRYVHIFINIWSYFLPSTLYISMKTMNSQ